MSDVQAGIATIQRLFRIGRQSVRKRPGRAEHGAAAIREEAAQHGIHENVMRMARHMADRLDGYSTSEVRELCAMCRRHGYVMSTRAMLRIVSLPRRYRFDFQLTAVREGWSARQIDIELLRRYGPRRHGGRRAQVPADEDGLMTTLERSVESWRKTWDELPCKLPPKVERSLTAARNAMHDLHAALSVELGRRRPGRGSRARLREDG